MYMIGHVQRKILKFCILSETDTREPLCILLRLIDITSNNEVEALLDVMNSLIREGLLYCYCWSKDMGKYSIISRCFLDKARKYIQETKKEGKSLIAPSLDSEPFEFIQTENGRKQLDEMYNRTKDKAKIIIEIIEKYKMDKGYYPKQLSLLSPDYLNVIEEPETICGSWWYFRNDDHETYNFGFFTFYGHLYFYNKDKKDWEIINS